MSFALNIGKNAKPENPGFPTVQTRVWKTAGLPGFGETRVYNPNASFFICQFTLHTLLGYVSSYCTLNNCWATHIDKHRTNYYKKYTTDHRRDPCPYFLGWAHQMFSNPIVYTLH